MLLQVDGLCKTYRKRSSVVLAVDHVSFQLEGGQILGFLGPNGAGKSTTIKMIAGLISPDDGDSKVLGESTKRHRQRALRHVGAVLEGSRNLYWRLSPLENLQYWAGLRGVGKRDAVLLGRQLLERFELSDKMNHTVQQLSRGMQQKVAICAALIHQPDLLLLDEPTLGLDLDSSDRIQEIVLELVREQGIGVVLTTHQMDVAEALSDRIAIIQNGRIVLEGEKREVLDRFEGNVYVIELAERVPTELRPELERAGAVFEGPDRFRIPVDSSQDLYQVVSRLKPVPVVRIEREQADLATVFRHYTHKEAEQGSV